MTLLVDTIKQVEVNFFIRLRTIFEYRFQIKGSVMFYHQHLKYVSLEKPAGV